MGLNVQQLSFHLTTPQEYMWSLVQGLPFDKNVQAYITGLFVAQTTPSRIIDFSHDSIVQKYLLDKNSYSLQQSQELGDWVLWTLSWFPNFFQGHTEIVQSIGRLSFYRCYKLVPSWVVYEDLADNLHVYSRILHSEILK